ncbi:MAG: DUF481 domain-containing protein [Acidobacteriaceae bacterium]|nr:DUF481 domain-containing protein [Acidobacteriaceae bacterium]
MRIANRRFRVLVVLFSSLWGSSRLYAADPDVLICKDGEKFVGHLVSAKGASVVFKSDVAGQVTIDWSKIQELHTVERFAVLNKGLELHGAKDASTVPQGTISATDQQVQVSGEAPSAAPQSVAVTNVARVVDEPAFQSALRERNFFGGWNGGATVNLAYTSSTQQNQSYGAALNLTRSVPGVDWMDQRSRTLLNFNDAYGEIRQSGTPTAKTSILHAGVEQDFYFSPRMFGFGQVLLDHNYSLGLHLQQDYGGGIGVVVFKTAKQELDAKASVDYIDQQFAAATANMTLVGSTFGETYTRAYPHKIVLTESGDYIPAWNNTNAFSAVVNANLTFPVYHRFGFTFGGIDNYLNDPPVGFKRNSFTLTLGATYSLQ